MITAAPKARIICGDTPLNDHLSNDEETKNLKVQSFPSTYFRSQK
jgi:hypothetical protein